MTTVHPAQQFGLVLREYRDRARLSQSKLAEAAGYDHSYVTRLESGARFPTRTAVTTLADALKLADRDRDYLLAAAGHMPGDIASLLSAEPALYGALRLLQDRTVPVTIRADVRDMIALVVHHALRRSAELADACTEDDDDPAGH